MTAWHDSQWRQWKTADDDEVDLVVRERRPAEGLTSLERRLVSRKLTTHGISAEEIARIVSVTPRTVHRWRAEARANGGPDQPGAAA